jgi:hypothetical protein
MSLVVEVIVSGQPTVIEVANVGPQGPPGADGDGTAYYGQMVTQTSQTVNIATGGTYVPLSITGTFDTANAYGFVAPTAATFGLKNDSGATQLITVIASADVSAGNQATVGWRLAVDGVVLAETTCGAVTGTTGYAKVLTQWIVEVGDGEEVVPYITNSVSGNITIQRSKIVGFTAGRQGEQGLQGPTGPASTVPGPTGPASTVPGPTGPASTVPGPTGPASTVPGPTGPASTVPGPTGPASTVPGPTGPASTVPGPTGPASTVPGPTGPQGEKGDKGDKGDQGDVGPTGPDGPTGPASTVPGPSGPPGPSGTPGPSGPAGTVVYDDIDNILAHQVFS